MTAPGIEDLDGNDRRARLADRTGKALEPLRSGCLAVPHRPKEAVPPAPLGDGMAAHFMTGIELITAHRECARRAFTDRHPTVADPYARRTRRVGEIVGLFGHSAGAMESFFVVLKSE